MPTSRQKFFVRPAVAMACLALLAISCNRQNNNDLQRPAESENQSTSQNENPAEDSGEVAGTEIIPLPTKTITVANQQLTVEVADTDPSRERGLSGRDHLEEGAGMLFDFTSSNSRKPGFWMKDMLISIDIIWIAGDTAGTGGPHKIIGIESNAPLPPEDGDLPVYYPPAKITHVLEVPAGWATKNNIVVGEAVSF
jgi:uncharacterized protein